MVNLPPPVWALIYVLVCLGVSKILGWPRLYDLHSGLIGLALIVLGFGLSAWAVILFRISRTELNPLSDKNNALVTSGPFGFTRNPMYLGLVIVTLGVAVWIGAWPMLLAPVAVFATASLVHIPFEEFKMRRQFPEAFEAYVARVRRWI
jgi:protein-S-isoprenylcysteine O-methyltransferase Ste14